MVDSLGGRGGSYSHWWKGMVGWEGMARQSRSATVWVLLLSDAAATTSISTTKLFKFVIWAVAVVSSCNSEEKGTRIMWQQR